MAPAADPRAGDRAISASIAAGRREPLAKKRVTLADVAAAAGVSGTTASLVLTGRGSELRISTAVQERVRETADRLGYRPNAVSIGLRKGTTRTLGFISDNVATSQLAGDMILGALQAAREHGFMLFIAETEQSGNAERDLIHAMQDRQVDGVVLATMFTRTHKVPAGLTHPTVLLNSVPTSRLELNAVVPDELEAGRAAARLLIERGHRKIYLVGAGPRLTDVPPDSIAGTERLQGIGEALRAAGIEPAGYFAMPDWTPPYGRAAVRELLQQDPSPGALICFNDRVAFAAYQVLGEAGLRIPHDVSIVSFDDYEIASWMRPGLTTFALPHKEMGRRAVELLIAQIDRGDTPVEPPAIHRIPLTLHTRESVASPAE